MDPGITIRRAEREDLPPAARLLAAGLGFAEADAVPAWFMRTTEECGGLTLVARAGSEVVGASYAVPVRDGSLFSCGLAVDRAHRGLGIGLELKLAQRSAAIALGCREIRWTTDPVNGRALRLYLSGLGARLVGYRAGLHDGLRADPGHPLDDVDILWPLDAPPPARPAGARPVELPWTAATADDRRRVGAQMSELLGDGYVGAAVEVDRPARACRVLFTRDGR